MDEQWKERLKALKGKVIHLIIHDVESSFTDELEISATINETDDFIEFTLRKD